MRRDITNVIRWFMDELLPPIVRDNKYFMYPLFHIAYRGKNVDFYMNFKEHAYSLSKEEFAKAYQDMDTIGSNRPTDMNEASMLYAIENFDKSADSFLDVGCGRGFWLNRLNKETEISNLIGMDILESVSLDNAKYIRGEMESIPMPDNSIDIVFASHTVEHVRDLDLAISELARVAKKQVIIIVPHQRFYSYTLDMHLNFFPTEEFLRRDIGLSKAIVKDCGGDWVYIANVSS